MPKILTRPRLIRSSEILHDLADVGLVDWRTVDLDHLGHLGPPEVLLEFRPARLGLDIVGRMAAPCNCSARSPDWGRA